jgi:hypothetical protein
MPEDLPQRRKAATLLDPLTREGVSHLVHVEALDSCLPANALGE